MMAKRQARPFKERHFTSEVIPWTLRWHPAFPVSDRDLALLLADRGVAVDHITLFRWNRPPRPRCSSGSSDTCSHAPAHGESMKPDLLKRTFSVRAPNP